MQEGVILLSDEQKLIENRARICLYPALPMPMYNSIVKVQLIFIPYQHPLLILVASC